MTQKSAQHEQQNEFEYYYLSSKMSSESSSDGKIVSNRFTPPNRTG